MADPGPERDHDQDGPPPEGRPELSRRDVWRLIFATYRASLPYFLITLASLILATWLLTRVLF